MCAVRGIGDIHMKILIRGLCLCYKPSPLIREYSLVLCQGTPRYSRSRLVGKVNLVGVEYCYTGELELDIDILWIDEDILGRSIEFYDIFSGILHGGYL